MTPREASRAVTQLLSRWSEGDRSCEEELFSAVYAELSRIAGLHMRRERPGHTLDSGALVHEAYMRLVEGEQSFADRRHFYAVASRVMRRLLVDYGRARGAEKRGGGATFVTLETGLYAVDATPDPARLDTALASLERLDPEKAELVALRHLAGVSTADIAAMTGISERSVRRSLAFSRAFIRRELES